MSKFNVNFSETVYRLLGGLALDREQTMADVLRDEISRAALMDDELRKGHRILIDRGKGNISELVFPHEPLLRLHPERPMPPALTAPIKVAGVAKHEPAAARNGKLTKQRREREPADV